MSENPPSETLKVLKLEPDGAVVTYVDTDPRFNKLEREMTEAP